ncbi:hypothetical protein EA658_11385 [Pseudoxanthomonas winnipegensis]|uniref:Uncharacterized protein n=1 Tax=Pseudoxanthomonas winnipegensis TaxID=2480810 RepID=A0ABY1WDL6_9GAMM|nr:hypothetical protein EA659_02265 [Pseudoxanthomonas winnipegensis]TAA19448.1 hypothetical protein EA658_11385 [Pseudoxanthomonas winnipegensis]TAH70281.1 hypothetical protein EA657_18450 [Pseudoxanthomonas winnipegensis]
MASKRLAQNRRSRESGNPRTLRDLPGRPWIPAFAGMTGFECIAWSGIGIRRVGGLQARSALATRPFYRHSRESGNPWTLLDPARKSMDPRVRGNDEL